MLLGLLAILGGSLTLSNLHLNSVRTQRIPSFFFILPITTVTITPRAHVSKSPAAGCFGRCVFGVSCLARLGLGRSHQWMIMDPTLLSSCSAVFGGWIFMPRIHSFMVLCRLRSTTTHTHTTHFLQAYKITPCLFTLSFMIPYASSQ